MTRMLDGYRILITGGAGFIGSHLAERLAEHNKVTLFDSLHRNAIPSTALLSHPNIDFVEGDILDSSVLTRAMEGHDVVFHCAAIAGVDTIGQRPVHTLKVNVLGSVHVLDAALKQVSMRRVVCFSTSEVFGRWAEALSEDADARIGPPGEPRWTYSAGKLAEEHLAAAYYLEYGLPTTVLRPFNIFGPRQVGEGAIRNFVLWALRDEPLQVRGDGSAIRAWTYIDDMVEGACRAAESDEAIGQDFNIGNPYEPITVMDLARRIVDISGSSSSIEMVPAPTVDIAVRVPAIAKARRLLGFEPQVGLDDGIERTIRWMRERS